MNTDLQPRHGWPYEPGSASRLFAPSLSCLMILAALIVIPPIDAVAALICTSETHGNDDFRGISGSSDSNVIAVGEGGSIFRYNGNAWATMTSPTTRALNDVEVVNASTAFAVGQNGTILQWNGSSWVAHTGVTSEHLYGVWAVSASEAYVVGRRGTIFRYNGTVWSDQSSAAGTDNRDLEDAWGDGNSFYAMSDRGELYRYNRGTGTWAPKNTSCNAGNGFEDLWGDAGGNLYLVRRDDVYRYNGAVCPVVANASQDLHGIYGSVSAGRIFAVGQSGTVLQFDGTSWQESTEATRHILDDWVSSAGTAYFSAGNGELTICREDLPQIVADWHLDECTLGIAGSTVADSGPNGLNGVTAGGLNVENSGQLCSAAEFNGSSAYVSVPDSAPLDLGNGISIAVWVRHDASPLKNWEAILAKGDSAYRLHLNGGCEIPDALPGNVAHGFTLGLNGGCAGADLNSNIVPLPGVWYHVAATYDSSVMRIYVNGVLINSASYSAAIATNNYNLFIGENSQQRNRYWDGDIDELTVWDRAITLADVTSHMNRTRPCTNCSNVSFLINHDNYGIHCLAETIRVDTVDSLTGAPRTDYVDQLTLDTQTGQGTWTLVSGSGTFTDAVAGDGQATYDWPLGESTAEFALDYPQGTPAFDIDVYQTSNSTIRDDDTEGMITYSASGFTVTESALSNPPPGIIPPFASPRIAGTDFGVYIAAFGQTPTDPVCGVIESYTGPQNLKFWFNRNDPAGGTIAVTIDGLSVAAAEAAASNQAVVFSNGQAAVTAKYKDAGRISILMKDDSLVHPDLPTGIRGGTASIPVKPQRFLLTAIEDAGGNPNPAAADASGPVFLAAGVPFSVTVTALDAEGDATPNFGQESVAETVRLTSGLVDPVAGNDPGVSPLLGFGPFSGGSATGNNFIWPEVGIITLQPSIGDADYLGGGDVSGTTSGKVGRFIPDHFDAGANSPDFSTQCGIGGFTYIGQTFGFDTAPLVSFTARAATGSATQNYGGSFFKVTNASLQNRIYTTAAGNLDLSGLPGTGVDPVISDTGAGSGTLAFSAGTGIAFLRAAAEAPFDADISLGIELIDTDTVTTLATPVTFSSIAFDNGSSMRYGRVRLNNALGSELVDLSVPMHTEYFVNSATGFVRHTDDDCATNSSLSLGNFTANLSAGDSCVQDSGAPGDSGAGCSAPGPAGQRYREPPLAGDFNLFLRAPNAGNDGSATVTADVPPWLEFDWDASVPGDEDPTGIATFGIFDGEGRRIYTRELY